ncbi:MAG: UDP-N-acetylglucosamine 2-epimerase (non-hydrolyzing) [Halobacteriales archaeon]|nr:UDP-N-acetylglucosamine 2-epimerase (non-hydrolyzing) [Halobacteriales archaeon]
MVRVLAVVGTRPELVKMAPVLRALDAHPATEPRLLHTGQHYDAQLSGEFFDVLGLPTPAKNLDVGSTGGARQTADGLVGIDADIAEQEPAAVLTLGDTNAVLAATLAGAKRDTVVGHVEAGLRSYDRSMPEEVNRVVADHLSELLFAPTASAVANLAEEGIEAGVTETGNTVVDACLDHAPVAREQSDALSRFEVAPDEYALATIHRPHNTDDPDRLRAILAALDDAPIPVVLPTHPRTETAIEALGFEANGSLRLADPQGYLDFLALLDGARVVVTDSGGVQEEASVLETPCLTVRPNTERPETVEAGVNELVEPSALGARLDALATDADARAAMTGHPDLYGDGNAGERVVDTLVEALEVDE